MGKSSQDDRDRASESNGEPRQAEVAEILARLKAAVRQRTAERQTIPESAEGLRARLLELKELEALDEPRPVSPRPLAGAAIVFLRKVVYHLFLKWYLRPLVERDNRFRQLSVRLLSELIEERYEVERRLQQLEAQVWRSDKEPATPVDEEA